MTTPTDPRGSNASAADQATTARGPRQPRDTVMLSDVPEPEAFAADVAAARPLPQPSLNLSSSALAALSQRYDILSEAGCGSMGQVFKARDRETGETVALKLLKPEIASDQAAMDRFKNELLFARKITHKNVCRVHEFNRLGGIAYTSMEFVEGESLRSVLNRFGGLPVRKAIDLTRQICSGLKEAHAQGIVHRDLKPENVMIDARGNVKIMDFGIARSMESLTRTTGAMVGTPAYMAPEQVAGKPVDYRTDIYSLGLILYEIFTGSPAFVADNAVAVAMKQLREAPAPPHELDPGIPVAIERAILKSLEKEPDNRFQSIAELEKVFVASSAAGGAAAPAATGGRSTHEALAMQQTVASNHSAQTLRVATPPARPSRMGRTTLIVVVIVVGLSGLAFAGWAHRARHADQLAPPKPASAPSLPELAFAQASAPSAAAQSTPAEASPVSTTSAASSAPVTSASSTAAAPASSPADAAPPAQAASSFTKPSIVTPPAITKPAASTSSSSAAPAAVQQRADNAFKENQSSPVTNTLPPASTQAIGSVFRSGGASYIWVNRFEREDRAQDAARKIQGFGLKSFVLPRQGQDGKPGYAVFMGPLAPGDVSNMIDWLKSQGFPNCREVKPTQLLGRGNNGRGASQGSSQ